MTRLLNAIKFGIWAYRDKYVLQANVLQSMSTILELFLQSATKDLPHMTKMGVVDFDTGKKMAVLSIWVGNGEGANPYDRILELKQENEILKQRIMEAE